MALELSASDISILSSRASPPLVSALAIAAETRMAARIEINFFIKLNFVKLRTPPGYGAEGNVNLKKINDYSIGPQVVIRLYFTFCIGVFPGSPLCGIEGESRLNMRDVMIIVR